MLTGIGMWILSLCLIAIETWGIVYFFDMFMKRKRKGWKDKCRYIVLYLANFVAVFPGEYLGPMGIKITLVVLIFTAFCTVFYKMELKQRIFFFILYYPLLYLIDILSMQVENILLVLVWVFLLFLLQRIWKGKRNNKELSYKEWQKFCVMPLFTVASTLPMYSCYISEKNVQSIYHFIAAGQIMINFLVMAVMKNIREKGELLRENALTNQKKESQLAHYWDMQAVYERQGRKMHDYKNQIRTMQVLLKEGNTQAAAALAERLTESISVEMSAVNTNHPVVNAVLNQKFHVAREQGVSMIFRVGDMSGMRLDEEEIVILLSNLLDNAIHECVKVVRAERKAVINIKLVQEGGKTIFSVKNPVAEEVQIRDGIVLDSDGEMHGVGLMNVKAVVDKYGGDFAISCDREKFRAVVIL